MGAHHDPPVEGDGEARGLGSIEFQDVEGVAIALRSIIAKSLCFQLVNQLPFSLDGGILPVMLQPPLFTAWKGRSLQDGTNDGLLCGKPNHTIAELIFQLLHLFISLDGNDVVEARTPLQGTTPLRWGKAHPAPTRSGLDTA